jgi:hypothetical protein
MGCKRSCRKLQSILKKRNLTDEFDSLSEIKKEIDESLAIANAEPELKQH